MPLGFGLISCQLAPDDPRTWSDVYREAVGLTVRAEQKGLDSVWTTEHHFVDDGYMPSLLVLSAAMAEATNTIRIGTGVVLAPLYHPLRLAEDAATVALLSGGRLDLGLGLGWSEIEFEAFDVDISRRGRAMDEILQILPAAWTGEPLRWSGEVYEFPEVGVRPIPEARIPVIVGGTVDAAVRRAARHADGFFSNTAPDRFVHQIDIARREMERVGRDPDEFEWIYYAVVFPGSVSEALPHLWHQRWKYTDMNASASRRGPVPAAPPLTTEAAERMEGTAMMGSSEQIVERLNAITERVDVPVRLMARSHFATVEPTRQIEILDQLAEEVAPHV